MMQLPSTKRWSTTVTSFPAIKHHDGPRCDYRDELTRERQVHEAVALLGEISHSFALRSFRSWNFGVPYPENDGCST